MEKEDVEGEQEREKKMEEEVEDGEGEADEKKRGERNEKKRDEKQEEGHGREEEEKEGKKEKKDWWKGMKRRTGWLDRAPEKCFSKHIYHNCCIHTIIYTISSHIIYTQSSRDTSKLCVFHWLGCQPFTVNMIPLAHTSISQWRLTENNCRLHWGRASLGQALIGVAVSCPVNLDINLYLLEDLHSSINFKRTQWSRTPVRSPPPL